MRSKTALQELLIGRIYCKGLTATDNDPIADWCAQLLLDRARQERISYFHLVKVKDNHQVDVFKERTALENTKEPSAEEVLVQVKQLLGIPYTCLSEIPAAVRAILEVLK